MFKLIAQNGSRLYSKRSQERKRIKKWKKHPILGQDFSRLIFGLFSYIHWVLPYIYNYIVWVFVMISHLKEGVVWSSCTVLHVKCLQAGAKKELVLSSCDSLFQNLSSLFQHFGSKSSGSFFRLIEYIWCKTGEDCVYRIFSDPAYNGSIVHCVQPFIVFCNLITSRSWSSAVMTQQGGRKKTVVYQYQNQLKL